MPQRLQQISTRAGNQIQIFVDEHDNQQKATAFLLKFY